MLYFSQAMLLTGRNMEAQGTTSTQCYSESGTNSDEDSSVSPLTATLVLPNLKKLPSQHAVPKGTFQVYVMMPPLFEPKHCTH